tara:strand:+ start:974 stop:1159 length:186 start_codon:yes stop_codon:yes gene_type:complete
MKVKLKKGVNLSSMDNHCGLEYDVWVALNQGKTVELDEINKHIEDKIEKPIAQKQFKKEDK